MALPARADVRPIDPFLTSLSVGFKQKKYFWDVIAPVVQVGQPTGTYFEYPKEYWFRVPDGMDRAPGAPYAQTHHNVTHSTYQVAEIGVEESVDDVTSAYSQTPANLAKKAVEHLTTSMQMKLELAAADAFWDASKWKSTGIQTRSGEGKLAGHVDLSLADPGEVAGDDYSARGRPGGGSWAAGDYQWNDYTHSDPINDIYTAKYAVHLNTGGEPNSLAFNQLVYNKLREHPKIVNKFIQTQVGIMNPTLVAQALDIPKLYILTSIKNTAVEGADPGWVGADVWDKNMALVWYRQPTLGLEIPCTAYTFIWNEKNNYPWNISKYRVEATRSDQHRIFTHVSRKVVAPDYAFVIEKPIG